MRNSFANGTDQPFYLSIRVENIFFTPECRLNGLVQKTKNKMKESGKSQTSENEKTNDLSLMKKQISSKIQFLIQMYHASQESPQQQPEKKVAETMSFGKPQDVQLTRKLYLVPQGLTQLRITSNNELTLLIKNFSLQKRNQIKLSIYYQEDQQNKFLGSITVDANIFILMFLEDNVDYTTSSEMLCHKSQTNTEIEINDEKGNSHHAQVVFEIFVQRDRVNLERVMRQKRKGIQVVEFRQNIRNILRNKEKSLKTENLNSNIAEDKSGSDQIEIRQISIKKDPLKISDEELFQQKKQTKTLITKQLYQNYLKSSVQPQLFYQNSSSIHWQERDKIHQLSKINEISSDSSGFKTIKYQDKSDSIVDSEQNDSYESIRKTKSFILEQSNQNQTENQVNKMIREKKELGSQQLKSEKKMNRFFQSQTVLMETQNSTQKRKQKDKNWIGELKIVGILLLGIIMIALFFQLLKNTNTSDQYDENEDLNWN